jgi:hypothetical protein
MGGLSGARKSGRRNGVSGRKDSGVRKIEMRGEGHDHGVRKARKRGESEGRNPVGDETDANRNLADRSPGAVLTSGSDGCNHDRPLTHKGIMALAGTCMAVKKNVDIKLSYLAEAEWENTRRMCSKGGENLTDKQVLAIEAKVLKFHQKQMVEAKRIKEKMQMAGKGTGR